MALWKWVAGLGTPLGIIAAPIADSLVKEGKFPDGLGAIASTLWSWLSSLLITQVSFPLWLALLLVSLLGFGLKALLGAQASTASTSSSHAAHVEHELQKTSRHRDELKASNAQLMKQLELAQVHAIESTAEMSQAQETQQTRNRALQAEIASLKEINTDLKQQITAKLETPKEVETELPTYALKTLRAIAALMNSRMTPTLTLIGSTGAGEIETVGAIEILLKRQMLKQTGTGRTASYTLTPEGRVYYLELREKEAVLKGC